MKSKEINALFSFVSFLHDSAREFSNFNDYATDVTNLVNSPLSFAAKDHNDKMKAKAAMRLRIQEYSTPIIENVEGPIREKLAELGILNGGIGLNLIDFSSAVSEVKNSIYSDISDVEKCKAEYLEVCATITPLREYFFPLFHSIDRILIDELFPYFLPKESITDFNEYRSSNVEVYLPTAEQQGTDNYSTPVPEEEQPEEEDGCDYKGLAGALSKYIKVESDTYRKLKCYIKNDRLPNPAEDTKIEWTGTKADAGTFIRFLGRTRKGWIAAFSQPWEGDIKHGNFPKIVKGDIPDILESFGLTDRSDIK